MYIRLEWQNDFGKKTRPFQQLYREHMSVVPTKGVSVDLKESPTLPFVFSQVRIPVSDSPTASYLKEHTYKLFFTTAGP